MKNILLLLLIGCIGFSAFSQTDSSKITYRKLTYNDFSSQFSVNDTATVVIDLFFDKKSNAALGQMSFLPITVGLAAIPKTRPLGVGLTIVSLPLFINGTMTLIRYRNQKLYKILTEYKETKTMPKWVKRKAVRLLDYYNNLESDY
jgi:hypothetical protein